MRYSLNAFLQILPTHDTFPAFVRDTFDAIDSANAWELAHCRFKTDAQTITISALPDYGKLSALAERSLGHTLPPLGVLVASGIASASTDFKALQQALKHYLIARQLNDDAHDWQDDLKNGQITFVVSTLLKEAHIPQGKHTRASLQAKLQKQFWHHSLPLICEQMQLQVALARQALTKTQLLQPINIITKLLDDIETSITETLATQKTARSFLKHYRNTQS
jgi:hypothetical protein